jgi:hypothetical protein
MNKTLISTAVLLATLAMPGVSLGQDASASANAQTSVQAGDNNAAAGASTSTEAGAASTSVDATTSTNASASATTGGTSTSVGVQTDLNVNITSEQTTEIKQVITQVNVAPVSVDFNISLGVAVPKTIKLVALPVRIVEIVPQFQGFLFFVLADGRIVIVAPDTLKIVAILTI